MSAGRGGRDLSAYMISGNRISVHVVIGGVIPGRPKHETAATASPKTVAEFLRDLADDVECAGKDES